MVTMLIVDDDTFECACIKSCIDWELIGIQIIGEAINGSQGLSKVIELNPDIVLTDVKMPVMDGIEMSKKMRSIAPDIKIIFLSSYDDFEYAKQAINLKASAYIMKPVNEVELLKIVKTAADEITEKALEKKINSKLNNNYKVSLTLARQTIVHQILIGTRRDIEEEENMGLGWIHNTHHLCLLLSLFDKEKVHLITEGINQLNQRLNQLYNRSISVCVNAGVLITLVSFNDEINDEAIEPVKELLINILKERGCIDVRVEAVYENGENINPANQYLKIIQNSVNNNPIQVDTGIEEKRSKKNLVAKVEEIINSQYHTSITIESIAKMIHFTPNYIGSIFKAEKKISISRYLMNVRLQKVEELLKDKTVSFNDIASQCGYENITYFYTIFKKERGITPNEYRNRAISKEF